MSIFNTNPTRRDHDRSIKFTWDLGPGTNFHGEPCTATAQLFVYHDKDRKRFIAVAQRIDMSPAGGEMFTIGKNTSVDLPPVVCGRYSAKALDAAAAAALTELRSRVDEPAVTAVADPDQSCLNANTNERNEHMNNVTIYLKGWRDSSLYVQATNDNRHELHAEAWEVRAQLWMPYEAGHVVHLAFEYTDDTPDSDDLVVCERAFEWFNVDDLNYVSARYRAEGHRSLSVGDIVVINDRAYGCGTVGWDRIENFEPTLAER